MLLTSRNFEIERNNIHVNSCNFDALKIPPRKSYQNQDASVTNNNSL